MEIQNVTAAGRAMSANMESVTDVGALMRPVGVRRKAMKPRTAPIAAPMISDAMEPASTPSTLPVRVPPTM